MATFTPLSFRTTLPHACRQGFIHASGSRSSGLLLGRDIPVCGVRGYGMVLCVGWVRARRTSGGTVSDVRRLAAYQHIEPYKSERPRAAIIAGIQGGLCALIVAESIYGCVFYRSHPLRFEALTQSGHSFVSLLSGSKGPIRWCLWLSWITFFLGCIATAGTALLIWVFRFGAHDCATSSSGQVTCKDLELAIKIVLTVATALGCWIQSCSYALVDRRSYKMMTYSDGQFSVVDMPTVLRLVYSQFTAQAILSDKLEPEEEVPRPVDRGYLEEEPEMNNHRADLLTREPATEAEV